METEAHLKLVETRRREHIDPLGSTLLWGAIMVVAGTLIIAVLLYIGVPALPEGAFSP